MTKETERRRILVIDDNDAIHGDFRKTLGQQSPTERLAAATALLFGEQAGGAIASTIFEIESALQGQEGLEKVVQSTREGKPYAMAFVDMRMPPGWDGVETVKHLWEADPELQVVICTAYSDYSWEQMTRALGTTDRLLILKKPFDPIEVCQMATALSEKWKLKRQATLKLAELERMVHERTDELRRLAMTDKLTGLPNRAALLELLKESCARAGRDPAFQFAIHFIDFDRFKVINDSLGHAAGDQFLMEVGSRLEGLLERHGQDPATCAQVAARLGGDEFVVLQRGITSASDATALAERLVKALGTTYHIGKHDIHSTASIGVATSETPYQWPEDMLRDADSAMYRAKALGKARFALFSAELHQEAVERLTLENHLRRALQENQFELHYQPIVALENVQLVGFEALIRWRHPERGLITPAEFIPLAEETGLVVPIGQWVINEAARQLAAWRRKLPKASRLCMSVNCARKQLVDTELADMVRHALDQHGIPPTQFNLEITESDVMSCRSTVMEQLEKLRRMGVQLHMDDFGTGYSSLNCLHSLPLNILKIDRSFIGNVGHRRDYMAVVDAIILLAHNLGMKVVAEGIESPDHAAALIAMDCDFAQGYFFSKPICGSDAEAYIASRA